MVTEARRAPRVARDLTNAPASEQAAAYKASIERPAPIINSVTGSLEDLDCSLERLSALLRSNTEDLGDIAEELQGRDGKRLYNIWMIFVLAGEKLVEVEDTIAAVVETALAEKRARAS